MGAVTSHCEDATSSDEGNGGAAFRTINSTRIFPSGKLQLMPNTYVFVLCRCRRPLMPTTAPKARILLKQNRAKVFRLYPFTIQLNYETHHQAQPMEIRIDYGAKTHGIALVQQCKTQERAVFLGEAQQRKDVKKKMDIRREMRRLRRYRNTRYRKPRFSNRRRPEGWVPPTIAQRVESITRIARTLEKLTSITSVVTEIGMFDAQKMNDPEIEGIEYQQGPGHGSKTRNKRP
ncbi:MAG: RNA-guided endonuclease IscB [Promethearchaeati archaeon SRVP18_Atabeyarchaeia-1]